MDDNLTTIFDLLVVSRWIHFTATFVVFGCSFFWFYIGGGPATACAGLPSTTQTTTRCLRIGAILAAISGLAWLVATIANVTGGIAEIVDANMLHVFFFETPFGSVWIVRLVLLAILILVAITRLAPLPRLSANVLLGAALLGSQAWLGHAAEGGTDLRGLTMIAAYAVHVWGLAAWIGGLPVLAFALAERRRQGAKGYDLLSRYSAMALVAVALVLASGVINTMFHVEHAAQLRSSTYGLILSAKIALVTVMLALAAINRCFLMPRLRRDVEEAQRHILASIAGEIALAAVTVLAAAVLGITPPPH